MTYSVIIPVYNDENHIERAVRSVLQQQYGDFEVLIIDDGSEDKTAEICEKLKTEDSRIQVIHRAHQGASASRNAGLSVAQGGYVCFVDSDDTISDSLLKDAYEKAILPHKPDMVLFNVTEEYDGFTRIKKTDLLEGLYEKTEIENEIIPCMIYDKGKRFCQGRVFPAVWNKIYKKELMVSHHCTDGRIRWGEDSASVYECIIHSERVYALNDAYYRYNKNNPLSICSRYDAGRFSNNRLLFDYLDSQLGEESLIVRRQLNAFKIYWIMMAIFHDVKSGKKVRETAAHTRKGVEENHLLQGIALKGMPFIAAVYLIGLRLKLYYLIAAGSALIQKFRKK